MISYVRVRGRGVTVGCGWGAGETQTPGDGSLENSVSECDCECHAVCPVAVPGASVFEGGGRRRGSGGEGASCRHNESSSTIEDEYDREFVYLSFVYRLWYYVVVLLPYSTVVINKSIKNCM
jgi:hypothetical protein